MPGLGGVRGGRRSCSAGPSSTGRQTLNASALNGKDHAREVLRELLRLGIDGYVVRIRFSESSIKPQIQQGLQVLAIRFLGVWIDIDFRPDFGASRRHGWIFGDAATGALRGARAAAAGSRE